MQLRKWNVLPQDAADPVCVPGDTVSVPTCVSVQCGNPKSHELLVTGGIFGSNYHPAFPFLSCHIPPPHQGALMGHC